MMLNTRFLSTTDQKCTESSTYLQFLYYRQPNNFLYTAGEITKKYHVKN